MSSVEDQFERFKHRLEITQGEQDDAVRRHHQVRDLIRQKLKVSYDFLTGSYDRHTKTRPLRDVDVFVVLADATRSDDPATWLRTLHRILADHYGESAVTTDPPAVRVDFGLTDDEHVMSIEVAPAIQEGDDYAIPDPTRTSWMATNPTRHAQLTSAANIAFDKRWVPIIKMIKKWNEHHGGPVTPSFLLEVMALELVTRPWIGPYARELKQFFASAADRIDDAWPDPAGLGSPVSEALALDSRLMAQARTALIDAEAKASEAIRREKGGQISAALAWWQELFGPFFSKS